MSVSSGFYVSQNYEISEDGARRKGEYIFFTQITSYGRSVNGTATDTSSIGYNPTEEAVYTYGQYFVLMNTLIPLSLVVSSEFIKLMQAPFMNHDINMYDESSLKQCEPMNMTLHEEMAQIKYIFADKTGTLTANIMQFKACTIGSVCYDEDYRDEDYDYIMEEGSEGIFRDGATHTVGAFEEFPELPLRTEALPMQGQVIRKDRLTVIKEEGAIEEAEIKVSLNDQKDLEINDEAAAFEKFKKDLAHHFNEPGKESKLKRRRDSITKIVWNFTEAEKIMRNLIQKKRYFLNEETNLGRSHRGG
jgi:magnesium-transporting ATPase (P-type)